MSTQAAFTEPRPSILVVDDDESMRDILFSILKKDYQVCPAKNLSQARQILQNQNINLVLLDIQLARENGLALLPEIKGMNEQIEVIVITVVKNIKTAVEAMKNGAFDYINKDFDYDELTALVERALAKQKSSCEILCLREEIKGQNDIDFVFGQNPLMLRIKEIADRVASIPTTVLITGETGTGKELMARYIHAQSHVADKPFVTINLAAIPPDLMESILFGHEKGAFTGACRLHYGKFELANGGTLFLDEIGELRSDLQSKLLRVLQENEIERVGGTKIIPIRIRLIVATNVDLKEKVRLKEFRDDLFYRLNVVPINLPPLRQRREDIPKLTALFLERYNRTFNRNIRWLTPEVETTLMTYHWPGNIRELENVIERIVATSSKDFISITDIPVEYELYRVEHTEIKEGEELLQKAIEAFERNFLMRVLEESAWNQSLSAKRLGIHRKTLEYKIKKLNLGEIVENQRNKFL